MLKINYAVPQIQDQRENLLFKGGWELLLSDVPWEEYGIQNRSC
jgi:hypothetical protein